MVDRVSSNAVEIVLLMSGRFVSLAGVTASDIFLGPVVYLGLVEACPQSFGGLALSEVACDL